MGEQTVATNFVGKHVQYTRLMWSEQTGYVRDPLGVAKQVKEDGDVWVEWDKQGLVAEWCDPKLLTIVE